MLPATKTIAVQLGDITQRTIFELENIKEVYTIEQTRGGVRTFLIAAEQKDGSTQFASYLNMLNRDSEFGYLNKVLKQNEQYEKEQKNGTERGIELTNEVDSGYSGAEGERGEV